MTGLEPFAISAVSKAVDFLFDQAGKLMEERRDARRKRGEVEEPLNTPPQGNCI